MKELTKRQGEILDYIHIYLDENGNMPTLSEISSEFGFTEKAAWDVVGALVKKGKLEKREKGGHRGLCLAREERDVRENRWIPLYRGSITPEILDADSEEHTYVSKKLYERGNLFAFIVESHSMINVGIMPGDLCIMQRDGFTLKDNDIVLAQPAGKEDDEELELRRYKKVTSFVELWPENDSMGIIKASNVKTYGVLKELIRSY